MEILGKVLDGLVLVALLWAAIVDLRERRVPRAAGWGLVAIGLVFLLLAGWWLEALLYLVVLFGSGFRGALAVLGMAGLAVVVLSYHPGSLPLVVGLLYVFATFRLRYLGGGDAQLALGLIGMARDWQMLLYLFAVYVLLSLLVVLVRRGGVGAARRMLWVASHLDQAEADAEAISVPWAVMAAAAGWVYLWVLPGLIWR